MQHTRVIFALVVREMGARFGRSAGGYIWAIAEPLGGIALLTIAFSLALRSPPLGTSFILFYSTGHIPLNMFNAISRGVAGAVGSNRGLLTYPVVTPLDAVFAKGILNLLTHIVVAVLLLTGIVLVFDLHVNLDLGKALASVALTTALAFGIGTLNCVLFGFFPTWKNVWSVLTRPLLILSCVLFTYESVPVQFQNILWFNPVTHVVGLMRAAFYGTYDPQYVSYTYVLGIALTTFALGAYLLRRHAAYLIEQ